MHLRRSGIDRNKSESTRIQLISFDCAMWFCEYMRCVDVLRRKKKDAPISAAKLHASGGWKIAVLAFVRASNARKKRIHCFAFSLVYGPWNGESKPNDVNKRQTKKKRMNFHQRLKIHWRNGRTRPRAGEMNKNIIQHYFLFSFHFSLFVFFLFCSFRLRSFTLYYIFLLTSSTSVRALCCIILIRPPSNCLVFIQAQSFQLLFSSFYFYY